MDVRDIRFWVCNVHTGVVVADLGLVEGWSITSALGGGTMSGSVPVGHLRVQDGGWPDWTAVQRVHDLLEPGDYSLLVTAGYTALGEWVLTEATPTIDGDLIRIVGEEWEMYPGERSIYQADDKRTEDMYDLARWILDRVYTGAKVVPIAMTVPSSKAGVNKTLEWQARGGFYSDLIRDLMDSVPTMEWNIDIDVEHDSGVEAVKSKRKAVFGRPVLQRSSDILFTYAGEGQRSGNVLAIEAPKSWRSWTYQVTGVGAGNGKKRLYKVKQRDYADFPVKLHRGVLSQFSNVTSASQLEKLVQAELDLRSKSTGTVTKMRVIPEKVNGVPRVGTKVAVEAQPSPAFPSGLEGNFRVGAVTVAGSGRLVDSMDVTMAEVA